MTKQQITAKAEALMAKMETGQIFEALGMLDRKNADHQMTEYWLRGALLDRNICPDGRGQMDEELNCGCCSTR